MKMLVRIKNRRSLDSHQIAYPVGKDKDAYSINTYFNFDTETGVTETHHEVIKNKYKEYERLHEGSYNECFKFIEDIVKEEV